MKREEAIKILNALAWVQGGPNREEIITAISMAIEALSADVVSRDIYDKRTQTDEKIIDGYRQEFQKVLSVVVRCKDCRHKEHCHETVAHTRLHDGFYEYWSEPIEWCSRGESKGGVE